MVRPYLNEVGGKVDDDVSVFSGGLNTYQDKAFLEPDQMPFVKNMCMGPAPSIETRPGRVTVAQYMNNKNWNLNVGDIIDIWAYDQFQFFVIANQNGTIKLFKVIRPKTAYGYEDNYLVDTLINLPDENNYYFTLAKQATNEFLYVTGLGFKVRVLINGNPLFTSATRIYDDHYGICCCHKGRLFLGQPDSNIVTFSALYDYDNFDEMQQYQVVTNPLDMADTSIVYLMQDANADNLWDTYVWDEDTSAFVQDGTLAKTELIIDTTTGLSMPDYSVIAGDFKITNSFGKLVSLKSFDDKLMIFCEHSMHCMYGDTPDVSMQNQFQLVDLNNNLGAVSDRCIAIGGGRLFWLGDNREIYEYTGAAMRIISRPGKTRNETISVGGVSGIIDAKDVDIENGGAVDYGASHSKFVATSEKLYVNIWNAKRTTDEKLLLVFDIYNRTWWCEDGEFNTIGNFSQNLNKILLGKSNGDILISDKEVGSDYIYNFDTGAIEEAPIEYEFHTRVYGAEGTDLRKTIADVWVQARANSDVYINDIWTSLNAWNTNDTVASNLVKIGTLVYEFQTPIQSTTYRPNTYEQQVCYVEKMYGQRLNAFQIVVKGTGKSVYYLMKREWRAR